MPLLLTSRSRNGFPSLVPSAIHQEIDEVKEILAARRLERTRLELKYEFAALRFETAMLLHAYVCRKAGFQPDQPRDDHGRWSGGAGTQTQVVGDAATGISTIDNTTDVLTDILANVIDFLPEGSGPLYGITVHSIFGLAVRFGNIPGIGIGDVETSWGGVDSRYGSLGSIRMDIILRNDIGDPIAIYDVKTGGARLTDARANELREAVAPGSGIPVIEMHVGGRVTVKGIGCAGNSYSKIIVARRWLAFEGVD